MKYSVKKAALSVTALVLTGVLIISGTIHNSAAFSGLNPQLDTLGKAVVQDAKMASVVEGQICDRNYCPITVPGEAGEAADLVYDESFSYIVGYNSDIYGLSGLRSRYQHLLFDADDNGEGTGLVLTLETGLQEFCYGLIKGKEGSVTVLDPTTGEVLAMASSAGETAYRADLIDSEYETYAQLDSFFYDRATMAADPPGSTFKIVTSLAMLDNGLEELVYEDTGSYSINGITIYNYGKRIYGTLDLASALQRSSNAYFCEAGLRLGANKLEHAAEEFCIGDTLQLDFCTLYSGFEVSNTPELLAQTAFGQGRTTVSPLHLAMMIGAIQNDGTMMKPRMVLSTQRNGESTPYGKSTSIRAWRPRSERESIYTLQEMLGQCAESYGFGEGVIAKSGTAELANGKNHAYMVMGAEMGERQYAVCVSLRNIDSSSDTTRPICKQLLNYLKNYGGNL